MGEIFRQEEELSNQETSQDEKKEKFLDQLADKTIQRLIEESRF